MRRRVLLGPPGLVSRVNRKFILHINLDYNLEERVREREIQTTTNIAEVTTATMTQKKSVAFIA